MCPCRAHTEVYEPFQTRSLHHHHHHASYALLPSAADLPSALPRLRVNTVALALSLYSRRLCLCCVGGVVVWLCEKGLTILLGKRSTIIIEAAVRPRCCESRSAAPIGIPQVCRCLCQCLLIVCVCVWCA